MEEENKVWIDKEGIINLKITKPVFTEDDFDKMLARIIEMVESVPVGKRKALVDLTLEKVFTVGQRTRIRKKGVEALKENFKKLGLEKVALFTGSVTVKVIMSFMVTAAGIDNVRVFGTKEEALNWLKEP